MGAGESALPLAGTRVLELGHIVAGPTASVILADLGADVVKFRDYLLLLMNALFAFGDAAFGVGKLIEQKQTAVYHRSR